MAIAVSTFYAPRASVDGFQSTNPIPPIVGKHTNSFTFSHFSTYAGQVYDGLSQRRRQIKSLLSNDGIENKAQASQGFLHRRIDPIPPNSISQISDMPDIETEKNIRPRSPFRKWMVSIQKRNQHGLSPRQLPSRDLPDWLWGTGEGHSTSQPCYSIRAKNSSGSSFNFVSAVRSASVSLAELSTMTRSKANTAISRCASQVDHGTDVLTEPKQSEDVTIDRPIKLDPDALDRAVKRRRILDELVHTEEDYISDIRLLLNVWQNTNDATRYSNESTRFMLRCWCRFLPHIMAYGNQSTGISLTSYSCMKNSWTSFSGPSQIRGSKNLVISKVLLEYRTNRSMIGRKSSVVTEEPTFTAVGQSWKLLSYVQNHKLLLKFPKSLRDR